MNREELLNRIAASRNAERYLEIGIASGATFRTITCPLKHGVDPSASCTFRMTSDEFFVQCATTYDLIFIDGRHVADVVMRDIYSALRCLSRRGVVVLHDCMPSNEIEQRVPRESNAWTGDVWKAFAQFCATSRTNGIHGEHGSRLWDRREATDRTCCDTVRS